MNLKSIAVLMGRRPITLLAGLIWFPLPESQKKSAVIQRAKEAQADLCAMRPTRRRLVGLARSQDGAAPDQLPLGPLVTRYLRKAGLKTQNMLVAFPLPDEEDSWYYLMVRDGLILADGDQWGSESQIRASFERDSQASGWDTLACPAAWGHASSVECHFDEVVSSLNRRTLWAWRLRPVRRSALVSLFKLLVASLLLVSPFFAFSAWKKFDAHRQQMNQQRERQAAVDAERARLLKADPWSDMVGAREFAVACEQALFGVNILSGGWQLHHFSCKADGLSLQWRRLDELASTDPLIAEHPTAVIGADGMTASVTYPFGFVKEPRPRETLQAAQPALRRLLDLRALYGLALEVAPLPLDAQMQVAVKAAEVVLAWKPYRVEIVTGLDPASVSEAVEGPGFRWLSVEGTYQEGVFSYKFQGVQYVKS